LIADRRGRILLRFNSELRIYDINVATVRFFELRNELKREIRSADTYEVYEEFLEVEEEEEIIQPGEPERDACAPSQIFLSRLASLPPVADSFLLLQVLYNAFLGFARAAVRNPRSRGHLAWLLRWGLQRGAAYAGLAHYLYLNFDSLQTIAATLAGIWGWW